MFDSALATSFSTNARCRDEDICYLGPIFLCFLSLLFFLCFMPVKQPCKPTRSKAYNLLARKKMYTRFLIFWGSSNHLSYRFRNQGFTDVPHKNKKKLIGKALINNHSFSKTNRYSNLYPYESYLPYDV